jgi:hypothetical protein
LTPKKGNGPSTFRREREEKRDKTSACIHAQTRVRAGLQSRRQPPKTNSGVAGFGKTLNVTIRTRKGGTSVPPSPSQIKDWGFSPPRFSAGCDTLRRVFPQPV